ncbi:Sir2 family NAD-dependent protein deacetylase [Planobispora takensis]|uniref:protein acetyllysine N-acetyltransferase n=1 Tax=Planobispora takensis TaxID=1367882 RepID=A0A8J3T370_9ACTN|nr:Sir2 family NAD-dependent protein deacetylase [Planobispora takensis]GII04377.1 hypothetical protein Pta02_63850 [Planobispora takensis]
MAQVVGGDPGGVSGTPYGSAVVSSGPVSAAPPPGPGPAGTGTGHRLRMLADLVADGEVVVLSGAGLSTESGIPDYRGETGRRRRAEPMTYQKFVGSAAARRRYWARSHLGWRHIARAAPNAGHRAVAELQDRGLISGIITQNVDGLHQAAGARQVIELHGGLDRVRCLGCGERSSRAARPASARGQPRLARPDRHDQPRR